MSLKRTLALALVGAAALPAAASAAPPVFEAPPKGDNYLQPIFLNDPDNPIKLGEPLGFQADTSSYTTQSDMFNPNGKGQPSSGGPPEPLNCGGNDPYGKTLWAVFYSKGYGFAHITVSAGYDSVISVIPFKDPNTDPTPELDNGTCSDGEFGFNESLSGIVFPKSWYAIQVGDADQPPSGGKMQLQLQIDPPPRVNGDATLTWRTASGGARITRLVVSGSKGSRIKVSCTHHGCGRNPKPIKHAKKPLFEKPIGAVGPLAGKAFRPVVREAAHHYKFFRNRFAKAGTTVEIRITRTGYTGKYFSYKVTRSGVASKKTRCLLPGSNKPKKHCP